QSITHKFSVGGHEGYITVGMYEDGKPGEIFIVMAKEGSVVSGLVDSFATAISLALQYGVPLEILANKFSHTRFEPSGWTTNKQIPVAKSIMDYVFRWLSLKFLSKQQENEVIDSENVMVLKELDTQGGPNKRQDMESFEQAVFKNQADATPCFTCGSIMVRSGSCYRCLNCGATSGCS
ncbi:MAG: vitamin B12-dependent ribonucleotide reductase, partial [Spirochaetota bacterium]|nr:vitamin B12-dependent ribonucleotide reductase [Spirochaetota bacterium]